MNVCRCEKPGKDGDECWKCGKPFARPERRRPKPGELRREPRFNVKRRRKP